MSSNPWSGGDAGSGIANGQVLRATGAQTADWSDPIFFDDGFRIQDANDPTKQFVFQADTISTSTTRTYSLPDADGTLALIEHTLDIFAPPASSVDFNQQQALRLRIENRTSDPGSPATGEIWLRTDL